MSDNNIWDERAELGLVRYILISGEGITNRFLGMGITATGRLYDLAKSSAIKGAESVTVQNDWSNNCDLVFKGAALLDFLREYYPEYYQKNTDGIVPDAEYSINCVDLS